MMIGAALVGAGYYGWRRRRQLMLELGRVES